MVQPLRRVSLLIIKVLQCQQPVLLQRFNVILACLAVILQHNFLLCHKVIHLSLQLLMYMHLLLVSFLVVMDQGILLMLKHKILHLLARFQWLASMDAHITAQFLILLEIGLYDSINFHVVFYKLPTLFCI